MSEPRTLDEWRRASELADAELESFDRRAAARPMTAWEAKARAAGFTLAASAGDAMAHRAGFILDGEAGRRRDREALVNAAEDARLGLLRAKLAAEAVADDPDLSHQAHRRQAIVDAYCAIRDEGRLKPTVENVADRLDMTESSLKRERLALKMTGWPPTLDPW